MGTTTTIMINNHKDKEGENAQPNHWQVKFRKLKEFKATHGHIDANHDDMRPGLSRFIKNQMKKDQEGKLNKSRKNRLEVLGVDFSVDSVAAVLENDRKVLEKEGDGTTTGEGKKKSMWKKKYAELVKFHQENGTCNVPEDHPLAEWVQLQKKRFVRMQKNNPKKVELLNELGFEWLSEKKKRQEGVFQRKLALLRAFKQEHGHCDVPEDHPRLGRWMKSLRTRYASGALQKNHPKKVETLNKVGIAWGDEDDKKLPRKVEHLDGLGVTSKKDPMSTAGNEATSTEKANRHNFQKKLALLCWFKNKNGHFNVPDNHPELGHWTKSLRSRYASGELQESHPGAVNKLTKLGFVWDHQKDIGTTSPVGKTKVGRNLDGKNHRGTEPGKKMKMLKERNKNSGSNCDAVPSSAN